MKVYIGGVMGDPNKGLLFLYSSGSPIPKLLQYYNAVTQDVFNIVWWQRFGSGSVYRRKSTAILMYERKIAVDIHFCKDTSFYRDFFTDKYHML